MGANAVSTSPRAKEILGDLCSYCEPNKLKSIKEAIKKEYLNQRPTLPKGFKREFSWQNTAEKTLEVYEKILND
jgi:hypothetical protein